MIVAVVPCLNEWKTIGTVVLKAKRHVDAVVVIDDGCTDDTATIAMDAGATVVFHKRNQGVGAATRTGFQKAIEMGANVIVRLDGDGQHDASDIPALVAPILSGDADVVVGSRFLENPQEIPLYRRIGGSILTWVTNTQSGVKLTDSQSGFRAFSRHALQSIQLRENGFSVESEMQFAIKKSGLRVKEVPIRILYGDHAKRNPVVHGVRVLSRVIVRGSLEEPLALFGVFGMALLGIGCFLGFRVIRIYEGSEHLAVGMAIGAVSLCLMGALILFVGLILEAMKELHGDEN